MKNHLHIQRPWVDHPGEDGRHFVVAWWEWEALWEAEGREERETVGWETLLPVPVGEAGWEPDNVNHNYNDNGKPGRNPIMIIMIIMSMGSQVGTS